MAKRTFLPLTKLQNQLLFEYIRESGISEGANKLYARLKRDVGDVEHPAVNKNGNVAYKDTMTSSKQICRILVCTQIATGFVTSLAARKSAPSTRRPRPARRPCRKPPNKR